MEKRYFKIVRGSEVLGYADGAALGRIVASCLAAYAPGKVSVTVLEVDKAEFDAYKRRPGAITW